ncbi:MAG: glutathione S-transferase N-terminal domain-containing protein [Candidatus Aureabacteria bacterium]|nr:glutathione S-transferase N-terminal domain-containing protein [Candidatus Auribacterota bacterium]
MAHTVKVYSTPTCPYCIRVKAYLKESGVAFEDIDVSKDRTAADEMVRKSSQMGVPVIDIDGAIVIGFQKEEIARALGL